VEAVHLVHFSSVDDIAAAKAEILDAMSATGTLVFNSDDERVAGMARRHTGPKISFGLTPGADIRATDIEDRAGDRITALIEDTGGPIPLHLPVGGRHNLMNALAALGGARALELPLADGAEALAGFRPAPRRGEHRRLAGGVVLWDESYNSNPCAMRSVLAALAEARPSGRKVVVSGDMLELGPSEKEEHLALAAPLAAAGVALFIGVGPLSALTAQRLRADHGIPALACADAREAAERILTRVEDGDLVVVKGSRSMGTEVVADALKAARAGEAE
jgi:UDP-N-acetylmuramoyl-tripeptide--D-alanyl-D-alanine ligase